MLTVPQQEWTLWYYIFLTSVMVANAAICTYVYFRMPKPYRSQMIAVSALLFAAIAGGWAMTALVAAGFQPIMLPLFVQRFFWLLVVSSSIILIDLGVARLNGHAAGVYRLLHWWERVPKGKTLMYTILLATLYMVTS